MSNKVKDINLKNQTHYFFNDMINIKDFDTNDIKIDEKSYKMFLFTKLDMWQTKIRNTQKLTV